MAKTTKKSANKTRRTIYNQDYYKAQAMAKDPWFIEKVSWLKSRFAEIGCPIPEGGFGSYKEYIAWNGRFWKKFAEMQDSQEFHDERTKITGGKSNISREEYWKLADFEEKFLPPIYGRHIKEILAHFGFPEQGYFHDFVEYGIFLGKKNYSNSPFNVQMIRNKDTKKWELFIQIYGFTKKDDISNNWDLIANEQKYLPDYLGKSKEWETFNRDLEVYDLYKKLLPGKEIKKKRNIEYGDFFLPRSVDAAIFAKIYEKYPELSTELIRNIIHRTKKRLGELPNG
ncbi:MAG: hypothetical protein WC668_03210 [Patescibacteria group bacterium]|jgi:hypothetical protein